MSKDRKDVYLGDGLRRAIEGRKDSLSTSVNLIADRYQGIVERMRLLVTPACERVCLAVLAETRGHRLEAREIAAFPAMVKDWFDRHPEEDNALPMHETIEAMNYAELVALIDWLERKA